MKKLSLCLFVFLVINLNSQWVQQVVPGDVNMVLSIDFLSINSGVAGGWNTGFYGRAVYTTNSGANWLIGQIPDSSRSLVSVQMINGLTGYFGGAYNIIPAGDINPKSKFEKKSENSCSFRERIGLTDKVDQYSGFFLKTTSGGQNWFTYGSLPADVDYLLGILFLNLNTGFATASISPTGSKCKVLKTTNGGLSWLSLVSVDSVYLNDIYTSDGIIINVGGTKGFLVTASKGFILRSTNSGSIWNIQYISVAASIEGIDFSNSSTGFACGLDSTSDPNGLILKTTNSGAIWQQLPPPDNGDLFLSNIEFLASSGTGVCIGNKNMYDSLVIYKTTDYGTTWSRRALQLVNNVLISSSMIDQNNWFICGGASTGLIYKTTNGGSIGIQHYSNEIPEKYFLSQNYPNPFNPSTNFMFQLPKQSFVVLTVFDAAGREIERLVNQDLSLGTYEYEWNASNYSSGVYFYTLTSGFFKETKKMLLIK